MNATSKLQIKENEHYPYYLCSTCALHILCPYIKSCDNFSCHKNTLKHNSSCSKYIIRYWYIFNISLFNCFLFYLHFHLHISELILWCLKSMLSFDKNWCAKYNIHYIRTHYTIGWLKVKNNSLVILQYTHSFVLNNNYCHVRSN